MRLVYKIYSIENIYSRKYDCTPFSLSGKIEEMVNQPLGSKYQKRDQVGLKNQV